jgi:hypothetical protein
VVTAKALRQNHCCVSTRVALLAASAAAPLVLGVARSSLPANRAGRCQPAQVMFTVERQPINSVTTGFSVTAKTRQKGFSCTVQGYPSLTVPGGAHGPLTIVSRPHLGGTGTPERVVTLSASARRTGGFYAVDTRSCDSQSGAVGARVRFGLPNGGGAHGTALVTLCKGEHAVLVVGPFSG